MPRFFRRLAKACSTSKTLKRRTFELPVLIARGAQGLRPARTFAGGFSNGATSAASLLLSQPMRLAGAMLSAPCLRFEPSPPTNLTASRSAVVPAATR